MRRIMRDSEGRRRDLIEGVKVYFDDGDQGCSALLIPDKERPLFHINAEAGSQETADVLATEYEMKVIKWRDEP
jgi:phosphomannomutase